MRFEFTRESQARFRRGLNELSRFLRKSRTKLLTQLGVFYVQAARKETPGPWYGSTRRTLRKRPIKRLGKRQALKMGFGKGDGPNDIVQLPKVLVEVYTKRKFWFGKSPEWIASTDAQSPLREIKYRGAAQISWNSALAKLFKPQPPKGEANFARVLAVGASVDRKEGIALQSLSIENNLRYIAKLKPGIVRDAVVKAENRFANVYLKKLGQEAEDFWRRQ